jgi:predicted membrane protein
VAIDYGLAIIMLPTVMMGSFIGVIMNAAMPDLILQVCLTLLLAFLTVQSAFKAREIMKKENEKLRAKKKVEKEKKRESNRILGIEETDEVKEDKDLNWEDNSNSSDPSFITTNSIVVTNNNGNKDTMVTSPKAENEISSPKQ